MTELQGGGPAMALSQEQINTAMRSPGHLRAWLDASGRRWVVFNGLDLIEALPWPHGVDVFMQVVMAYRDYRRTIPTGEVSAVDGWHPKTGERYVAEVTHYKGESLELEELDRAIRYLVAQIMEKDPTWSLEKPAL